MTDLFIKHVALQIPHHDIEVAKKFYTDFGLSISLDTVDRIEFSCDGLNYPSILLIKGTEPKSLHHVEVGVVPEKMQKIKENFKNFNFKTIDEPKGFNANGIWVH